MEITREDFNRDDFQDFNDFLEALYWKWLDNHLKEAEYFLSQSICS